MRSFIFMADLFKVACISLFSGGLNETIITCRHDISHRANRAELLLSFMLHSFDN